MGMYAKDITRFVNRYHLYNIIGYAVEKEYLNTSVTPQDKCYTMEEFYKQFKPQDNLEVFVAIHQFHNMGSARQKLYEQLKNSGYKMANIIAPSANIFTDDIGDGVFVEENVHIANNAIIGCNTWILQGATICHYTQIGNNSYIGQQAVILGNTAIGNNTFVGANATVFNKIRIGEKSVIGAGTTIKRHVPKYCVCKGPTESIVVNQYNEQTIDNKLRPIKFEEVNTYDVVIK